ncbi:ribokinase [Limosilactobacillus antri]|uniref:Ribokinase n=1 Tax=Limosilactobacillus antri DSM 16041 TaxID=525309 RepID=C8P734_9LACO|nr:ribokinase [Limosilactobacillus antri]EEW53694.1 ribokinase [Limosilactobacillus antri DSM 16041]KRK60075.1 ribokinase [Limosilactobacillus antri DSM 16041]
MNKVTIVGSLNVDTTLRIKRMPLPGETLAAEGKSSAAGGKGANQAVSAARSGAQTAFIGEVGKDNSGQMMLSEMKANGIDVAGIRENDQVGTGTASILLDENGQNSILIYGGANQQLSPADVEAAQDKITTADFVVAQFETPQAATLRAFQLAKENGVATILNPAPAQKIDPEVLKLTDLIIPNETESAELTGVIITDETSMLISAAKFAQMGVRNLIITVGAKGAFYCTQDGYNFIPAFKVNAVDTTAAGDTFIGALSSQLKPDMSNIEKALVYAQRASSLAVQKMGALPSIPTKEQILAAGQN